MSTQRVPGIVSGDLGSMALGAVRSAGGNEYTAGDLLYRRSRDRSTADANVPNHQIRGAAICFGGTPASTELATNLELPAV